MTGKAVGNAINLYTSTTGGFTIGSSTGATGNVTINGANTVGTSNLFTNSTTSAISIGTAITGSGSIAIGNASTVTIKGASLNLNSTVSGSYALGLSTQSGGTTAVYGSVGGTNSLFTNTTTGNTNILTGITTGNIIIGNSSTTNVTGNTTIYGTSVSTASGVNSLFTNTTTANTNIATGLTSGLLTIGSTASTAGNTINGDTRIINTLLAETLTGRAVGNAINLYTTSTGTITLGKVSVSANTITGITNVITGSTSNTINGDTTITNTLLAETLTGKAVGNAINLYTTSTGTITLGKASVSANTITGISNTITGNTTITNTLLVETLTGKAVGNAINLYTSTTGLITLGNSSGTIAIYGIMTINNYITTSLFNPIVSTNSLLNMILSNKTTTPTGQNNTGLGVGSLTALTTGRDNTGIGANSLNTITDQSYNTSIGSGSLAQLNALGSASSYNTAIGSNAGNLLKYGQYNCFLGQNSGFNIGVGQTDRNTFIGSATTFDLVSSNYTQSTALGYGATISGSNQIVLGTASETVIAPNIMKVNTIQNTSSTGNASLYSDVTTGSLTLGVGLTTGNVSIGNYYSSNTIEIAGNTIKNQGHFLTKIGLSFTTYYPFESQVFTSTTSILYYYKYNLCNFSSTGYLYLDTPLLQHSGMELVIRQIGSAAAITSTVAGTNVFVNLSNSYVSSLTGTVVKVVCMPVGTTYYWFQI